MMNKKFLLLAFIFFTIICYSQNLIVKFQDKIDFNLLNELVKMSDDAVSVSNSDSKKKLFYFYDSKTNDKIFANEYEMAYPFVGETAIVKYNKNWGLINRSGKFLYYSEIKNTVGLSSYEKYAIFNNGTQEIYNLGNGEKQSGFIYCAEPAGPDFWITKTESGKYKLLKSEDQTSLFPEEVDSIILQHNRPFTTFNSPIILKNKNKYGLYLSDSKEILKMKFDNMKFLGDNYILVLENKKWNYYIYENNQLNLVLRTEIECQTAAYQNNLIGVFRNGNKYNLLKTNGKILSKEFDYINSEATFGIDGNSVVIFDSKGNFYNYYNK
ncbi:hypothetical protein LUD75_00640 [Epilithonimonas sp. JDS]|uniref:WG repeat-containing protein n=1 Tax=Epilithonimonas sp. JDS TaxID=2902797 RepID=UPI001E41EC20|nr:WG repeat-containing protein [Epilithonimonas sp. JDS]MCD9853195.1 hypothetical protein [Epilithonimonas sp. JDS]